MVTMQLKKTSCRGCQMCVEVCPTDVFAFDDEANRAEVVNEGDCIGCLSCAFQCPSNAISHQGVPMVKNFYRDLQFCRRMRKFL